MARKKQSASDRIVAEILSMPPAEARLMIQFCTTALNTLHPTAKAEPKPRGRRATPIAVPNAIS